MSWVPELQSIQLASTLPQSEEANRKIDTNTQDNSLHRPPSALLSVRQSLKLGKVDINTVITLLESSSSLLPQHTQLHRDKDVGVDHSVPDFPGFFLHFKNM